ncbi:MAG: hypothetical protein WDN27_05690 [Candidatus Saccharibacteria bacterium]
MKSLIGAAVFTLVIIGDAAASAFFAADGLYSMANNHTSSGTGYIFIACILLYLFIALIAIAVFLLIRQTIEQVMP